MCCCDDSVDCYDVVDNCQIDHNVDTLTYIVMTFDVIVGQMFEVMMVEKLFEVMMFEVVVVQMNC